MSYAISCQSLLLASLLLSSGAAAGDAVGGDAAVGGSATTPVRRLLAAGGSPSSEVEAVIKRCDAQTAAGKGRCSELDRYMTNCIKVHGPQCLRCTYSTVKKVSAKASCCTAVRDARAYATQSCQVVAGPGYQLNKSGQAQPCSAGSAKPAKGNGKCAKCSGRTYQPRPRAARCLACPQGSRVNAARTSCVSYPPGTQPGRDASRVPCPAGTAKAGSGDFLCGKCTGTQQGGQRYSGRAGATACSVCPAGGAVTAARTSCRPPPPPPPPSPSPAPPPPLMCRQGGNVSTVGLTDANLDGVPDLVIAYDVTSQLGVCLGNGDGTFRDGTLRSTDTPLSSLVGMFVNNDNVLDLVGVSADATGLPVYLGDGNGSFAPGVPNSDAAVAGTLARAPDANRVYAAKYFAVSGQDVAADGTATSTSFLLDFGDLYNDLIVDATGRWLLAAVVSNGADYSIKVFPISPVNGTLSTPVATPLGGTPRGLGLSPDNRYLLVAVEGTGQVGAMKFNDTTGVLDPAVLTDVGTPQRISPIPADPPAYAVTDAAAGQVVILNVQGQPPFPVIATIGVPGCVSPYSIISADLDADGIPDLVVGCRAGGGVAILLGRGGGQFTVSAT